MPFESKVSSQSAGKKRRWKNRSGFALQMAERSAMRMAIDFGTSSARTMCDP